MKMNIRQNYLYYYLEFNKEVWRKREKILNDLSDIYLYKHQENFNDSTAARLLTKDIQEINNSDLGILIISNTKKGIKLATEEEAKEQLRREQIELLSKWKRWHNKVAKMDLNGQLNIEGKTIESLLNQDNKN